MIKVPFRDWEIVEVYEATSAYTFDCGVEAEVDGITYYATGTMDAYENLTDIDESTIEVA